MPGTPIHDAALSGGGNRAAASGAVFARALARHGVWGKLREVYGVSGGTWFLIMLARGRLKGVDLRACPLEAILDPLEAAGITAALTGAESAAVTAAVSSGAGRVVSEGSRGMPNTTEASHRMLASSIVPGPAVATVAAVATVGAGVAGAVGVSTAVRKFGTGAGVAVAAEPMEQWAGHLRRGLFADGQVTDYYSNAEAAGGGPLLSVCVATPRADVAHYAWLKVNLQLEDQCACVLLPVTGTADSGLDPAHFSARSGSMPDAEARAREALSARGKLHLLSPVDIELGRLAAICGSAFAFDFGYVLDGLGVGVFAPGTLLPRVTTEVLFVNAAHRSLALRLRDAGIDHNVPYLPATSAPNDDGAATATPAPAVLWVHDAGAGATAACSVEKAVKRGHLNGPYAPVVPTRADVGEGTRWQLFVHADPAVSSEPRVIVQIMGLTDDETMEPSSTERRRSDLTQLDAELDAALPIILKKLAPLGLG